MPRPSAVVPETLAGGDLRGGGELCVVGFRALKDFYAPLLADNLTRLGYRARSAELDLVPEGRADVNALGFARAFDTPAFRAEVAAQLSGRLGAAERVAFPAVLGIASPMPSGRGSRTGSGAWCSRCRRCRRRCLGCACTPRCARRCAAPAAGRS